mmetsp:Transcript_20059/g.32121  ORF Transcript_20059/g.32121 Transcript_20059/m.32121 type:complete len:122 (+) Transcript_20059:501-866(+)
MHATLPHLIMHATFPGLRFTCIPSASPFDADELNAHLSTLSTQKRPFLTLTLLHSGCFIQGSWYWCWPSTCLAWSRQGCGSECTASQELKVQSLSRAQSVEPLKRWRVTLVRLVRRDTCKT